MKNYLYKTSQYLKGVLKMPGGNWFLLLSAFLLHFLVSWAFDGFKVTAITSLWSMSIVGLFIIFFEIKHSWKYGKKVVLLICLLFWVVNIFAHFFITSLILAFVMLMVMYPIREGMTKEHQVLFSNFAGWAIILTHGAVAISKLSNLL